MSGRILIAAILALLATPCLGSPAEPSHAPGPAAVSAHPAAGSPAVARSHDGKAQLEVPPQAAVSRGAVPARAVRDRDNAHDLIVSLVIGALLCMLFYQLPQATYSLEHRNLAALILAALAYEFVASADALGIFGDFGTSLSRYSFQFECLVLVAATAFTAAFFDLKRGNAALHSLFLSACGILGVTLFISLTDNVVAERLTRTVPWLFAGLVGGTALYQFRVARGRATAFALACAPVTAGAAADGAATAPLLAGDIGLLLSLVAFTVIVSRRTERQRQSHEDNLRHAEHRYELALEGSNEGIFEWDLESHTVLASQRAHDIVGLEYQPGWRPEKAWRELIPKDELDRIVSMPEAMFLEEDVIRVETWCPDRHGDRLHLLLKGKLEMDDDRTPLRVIGSITDISEQKRLEERLRHDALHDFLTGLPNRTLLIDRIKRVVERLKRNPDARAALLFIGLDNFKSINDNRGHGFGDEVLVSLADRLVAFVRSSDTVARFGGDEFVILLEDMFSQREAERFANRILSKIQTPMDVQNHQVVPSVSIGMTLVEDPNVSVETVLGDADIAMYAAKERGKGRVVAFDTTMRTRAAKRLELESALRNALDNEELYLAYQPIFSLEDREPRAVGVEALLRWSHSDRGDIAPSDLLSLAEENGMIEDIGKWVIRTAAKQLAQWRAAGYPDDFYVNVNLSPVHFENEDIVSTILKEVDPLGLPRNALRVEIVETAVIRHPEKALSVIKLLQSQGILVSIDDFGTGFSSLSYLHRFPFHALKIDRSFVLDIAESRATRDIVTAIVVLARRLGIKVVAEGIENEAQLDFLRSVGCDLGQGFLLARPTATVDRFFVPDGASDVAASRTRAAVRAGKLSTGYGL